LKNVEEVSLIEPLDYLSLLKEIASSYLIWTDSGGIQEESPFFKKPILILRNVTERPEVVTSGFGELVGTDVNKIIDLSVDLITNKDKYLNRTEGDNPFGDGFAARRIVDCLL